MAANDIAGALSPIKPLAPLGARPTANYSIAGPPGMLASPPPEVAGPAISFGGAQVPQQPQETTPYQAGINPAPFSQAPPAPQGSSVPFNGPIDTTPYTPAQPGGVGMSGAGFEQNQQYGVPPAGLAQPAPGILGGGFPQFNSRPRQQYASPFGFDGSNILSR